MVRWGRMAMDGSDVVVMPDLIERSGVLKQELVKFALSRRFERELLQADIPVTPNGTLEINSLDHFILQYRLRDDRTIVERFVDVHPELSKAERAMLLGWHQVVEGVFA